MIIQKRTGLLRCYISRVENGHTVPSIETLEKMSRALDVSLYQLFYEGNGTPAPPKTSPETSVLGKFWKGSTTPGAISKAVEPNRRK
jgi:transcriptional regulator with XRE-family HTH domain